MLPVRANRQKGFGLLERFGDAELAAMIAPGDVINDIIQGDHPAYDDFAATLTQS